MAAAGEFDAHTVRTTIGLVDYLADLTDSSHRKPLRDITDTRSGWVGELLWLDEFPSGVELDAESDDAMLTLRPVPKNPPPTLPKSLVGQVDSASIVRSGGPEPHWNAHTGQGSEPDRAVRGEYDEWLRQWRSWAREDQRLAPRRELYEKLESVAKTLEQQDDEFEFVLAVGLVRLSVADEPQIRCRHLLIDQVLPALDRTGTIRLGRLPGKRRMEDRELFEGLSGYHPDRGRAVKDEILSTDESVLGDGTARALQQWLGVGIDLVLEYIESRSSAQDYDGNSMFVPAPALILRRRSQVLIAEAYRSIGDALREPGAEIPVALAQIVVDTERPERERWLERQGAVRGDVLGADPLFPLQANDEQSRVLELLRTETGVVVQGPPGTGKTHTIANLISALLARGQRVLVTSQKDQALRVLRGKIPEDLRQLCVLLTGGSKDASVELQQSLDALSAAIASTDEAAQSVLAKSLSAQRDQLRSRNVVLNREIAELRGAETRSYDAIVPGYGTQVYRGTLAEIVREVIQAAPQHDWMPPVPEQAGDLPCVSPEEWNELRRLLLAGLVPGNRIRAGQSLPDSAEIPSAAEVANLIAAEREAVAAAEHDHDEAVALLGRLGEEDRSQLRHAVNQIWQSLHGYGLADPVPTRQQWLLRAVDDRLIGRNAGAWAGPLQGLDEPNRLLAVLNAGNAVGYVIEFTDPVTYEALGAARRWLEVGGRLLTHLESGGKLRERFVSRQQKDAQPLLRAVRIDGAAPDSAVKLRAVLDRIAVEISAIQLSRNWFEAGVPVEAGVGRPAGAPQILSELAEYARVLRAVGEIESLRGPVADILRRNAIPMPLNSVAAISVVAQMLPAAERFANLVDLRRRLGNLQSEVTSLAARPNACAELSDLVEALSARDSQRYSQAVSALDAVRVQQAREQRAEYLESRLVQGHSRLFDLLNATCADQVWQDRDLAGAWAWSKARQFVGIRRTATHERRLVEEFESNEAEIKLVTARLVATEAMASCLRRLTDDQQRALNAYRTHMSKIGAGTGKKTKEFRRAARAAMAKAQGAVPAWVVPLPNLLENIAAERNRFDVVIVDEASQVGIEHLYLLWMAPRVIVVGDEKQCTPGASGLGLLDQVFARNDEHLATVDADIRRILTPRSNLYEVLSARSGKNALVRLREHFRCVPEIITWSSRQFYDDGSGRGGLIPLRQRPPDSLPPLRVTKVDGAFTEGRDTRRRNPIEAEKIVETLVDCLDDPAYADKSFGIVVLAGAAAHIKMLEHLVNEAISPEVREKRGIRVGTAPNFQGDERHVIFLSMVVAESPRLISAENYRQAFNVAATRARDQLWLFTSVGLDQLKVGDLRESLLGYILNPPSIFGDSPAVDEVSETKRTSPFESLFEQRVFRILRRRGYHVVPQYPVGARRLDLVVAGDAGRIAVECDGHYWHTDAVAQANDARRDRELDRMGWTTLRIRESEFEFDPIRALEPVWETLRDKGIKPNTIGSGGGSWEPAALNDDDESDEGTPS